MRHCCPCLSPARDGCWCRVEGEVVGIRKGSELYEVQTSDGESSWRGLQGAGVRWLDEPPPLVAALSDVLR